MQPRSRSTCQDDAFAFSHDQVPNSRKTAPSPAFQSGLASANAASNDVQSNLELKGRLALALNSAVEILATWIGWPD